MDRHPVTRMEISESERLLGMEDALHSRIIGQDEALCQSARPVRRARAGLSDPNRQSAVFFPRSDWCRQDRARKDLAEFLFDSEEALIRLDMSEYMERHTVAKLIGAPQDMLAMMRAAS